ncbi:3'-5' exonuclease [Embleya sp. MST-111070]|uniref:3'-5' exonuclease n=1 Tax=Embleya sp. MST-111070 TaxID=3398231 RepID=UPI003F7347D4
MEHLVESGLLPIHHDGDTTRFDVADLDRLAASPGLDWSAARRTTRGPSPWRDLAGPIRERDAMVRALVADLRASGVDAWARYSHSADRWTVDWPAARGGPERAEVLAAMPERLARALTAGRLVLLGPVGRVMHWAQAALRPGKGAVLDCESTGLEWDARVVEIAAVCAASGDVLVNTLVDPGIPIPDRSRRIHGIGNADVANAPTWDTVLPEVLAAIGERHLIAYNSPFDRLLVTHHSRALGLSPGRLALPNEWGCAMRARSVWLGTTSRLRLGGGHRALADVFATQSILRQLAERPSWTREFDEERPPP